MGVRRETDKKFFPGRNLWKRKSLHPAFFNPLAVDLTCVNTVVFGVSRYGNESATFPLSGNGWIDTVAVSTTELGVETVRTAWSDLKTLFRVEP